MIAPKTIEKLNGFHPEGTRHEAKIDLAMSLLGDGLSANAVVTTLHEKFPNASEREIVGVVRWCESKNPQPSGYGLRQQALPPRTRRPAPVEPAQPPDVLAAKIADGACAPEEDWISKSPVTIPENYQEHAALLIKTLYKEDEFVCGHASHGVNPDGRVYPKGGGYIRSVPEWIDRINTKGMLQSEAGCWWRMNPVKQVGSGEKGAPTDDDVTAFRFALVEHDKFPIDMQFALLARMWGAGLPIAAVILTGGKSVHAWAKLDARDAEDYAEKMAQLLSVTKPLGYDSNRNPSRLARIPGVARKLGAQGEGLQRLLYLDPNPKPFDFKRFEALISPITGLISGDALIARVREWMKPRKAEFTMDFLKGATPEEGFYFRRAEVTIWSGVTGHGKSSLLAQMMVQLVSEKIPIFVSSLEHKAEQICELFARMVQGRPPTAAEVETFLKACGSLLHFADTVGEITSEELFRLMRAAWLRNDCQHFVIDSLMRVADLEEDYPAQLAFVNELQSFAKESSGHIHLVAHPRKLDETTRVRKMDVKGSSAIPNNADNILSVRRNIQKQEADEEGKSVTGMHDAELSVEKQRATGWQGVVRLKFNPESRTFDKFKSSDHQRSHSVGRHARSWNND